MTKKRSKSKNTFQAVIVVEKEGKKGPLKMKIDLPVEVELAYTRLIGRDFGLTALIKENKDNDICLRDNLIGEVIERHTIHYTNVSMANFIIDKIVDLIKTVDKRYFPGGQDESE